MKSAIEKFASVDQTKPKHLVARGMRKQQQINGRWLLKSCTYLGLKATMSFVWLHKHWQEAQTVRLIIQEWDCVENRKQCDSVIAILISDNPLVGFDSGWTSWKVCLAELYM